ncbi:uncharacterized protein DUF2637 [Actinomadura pelletieri DSM 43383]|uniref:Uncharacterized protein DUF2637 n=1 Tax=Actinomadura pelletieri DSM 43383 TaxID=1120940 RepID=A0A495QKC5_9ACTN|nr:DUF2637 domain-containing protein [Actinomadura pelletieri]RKS73030.1 uncharacterized protein DUF2637 [Actinomadura pelletieri DSM 43383]
MNAANRAQVITRWGAIAFMAAAVLTATAGGFAQSYAGLYHWALDHGLRGWKAESFPLLVDLFIIVGELGLFLLAVDAFVLRRRALLSWLDFFLPLTIALAGWTASLVFNVGHVGNKTFSYQATAAVPPIVSMLGLFVLLRTLHRYVSQEVEEQPEKQPEPQTRAITGPVTLNQITLLPLRNTGPFPQIQVPGHSGKVAIESGTQSAATAENAATTGQAPAKPEPEPKPKRDQDAGAGAVASVPQAPAPMPEPAPELAVVSAAARGSLNGHGAAVEEVAAPAPDPETLRSLVIEILERRHGDIAATLADVRAEGYTCDEADIRRISDNHWFPYAVYRLLAKHGGDGDLVAQELRSQGITYDQAALDELVRSWRV